MATTHDCGHACVPSGSLRHWMEIERPTETQDAAGQVTRTWTTLARVPCSYQVLSADESIRGEQVQATLRAQFEMRWRSGVTPQMRIVFDGRTLNIRAVFDPDGMRVMLRIIAEEDAD